MSSWEGSFLQRRLEKAVGSFAGVSPELLASRALLRRVDSKFVVSTSVLPDFVAALESHYGVLRVPAGSVATYRNLYLDSPDMRCFHDHRRGRRIRHKVRFRHYPDRGVSYLEVKVKRGASTTDKHRLPVEYGVETLGPEAKVFLARVLPSELASSVRPSVHIAFRRISLVGLETEERITVDFELEARDLRSVGGPFRAVGVVEVKQRRFCARTPAMVALRRCGAHPGRMSKYVCGVGMTRPAERMNRLLPRLRGVIDLSAKGGAHA